MLLRPPGRPPARWASAVAVVLVAVGLLWPTSLGANLSVALVVAHLALLCGIVVLHHWVTGAWPSQGAILTSMGIVAVLFGATMLSPFDRLAPGALAGYGALAMVLTLGTGSAVSVPTAVRVLTVANVALLGVGLCIIVGYQPVQMWLVRWYSFAYPDLVYNMTTWRKPVGPFGSHSIAAVFYYLFFYVQLEAHRSTGRGFHLAIAASNVLVGLALTSVTAGALMGVAGLQLVANALHRPAKAVPIAACLVIVAALVLRSVGDGLDLKTGMALAFTADEAGFRGRYAPGGNLAGTLTYLKENPLRPVGLSESTSVFYGDSGFIEYLLRGSIPLLLLVYGGLGAFLRRNLVRPAHVIHLFAVILVVESGFTMLTYSRLLYLLPVLAWSLNTLALEHRAHLPGPAGVATA